MSDIVERLRAISEPSAVSISSAASVMLEAATEIEKLREKAERFQKLDAEAAEYVEVPICMRTHFTGEPPYVGWEGLGLVLRETLDERDRLREENERLWRVIAVSAYDIGAVMGYLHKDAPQDRSATKTIQKMLGGVELALGRVYGSGGDG